MTTTTQHTEHDSLEPANETEEIASDDSEIAQLSAEMEVAKQALADAAMRYAEAVQDATGSKP
jgi:hypothetical protein